MDDRLLRYDRRPIASPRRRAARPLAALAIAAAVVLGGAGTAAADTTTTTTVPAPPTAPAGFTGQMVAVYQSEYSAAAALGQAGAIAPVAQYAASVATMTPDQVDTFYEATLAVPEWSQIPALMQTAAADASSAGGSAPAAAIATKGAKVARSAAPRVRASGVSVAPFTPAACSNGPSANAVFGVQITIDALNTLYNTFSALGGAGVSYAPVIATVSTLLASAATIVNDTLQFLQDDGNECGTSNTTGYLANVDNTTTQDYSLETSVASALANLQTTADGTNADLAGVQSTVSALQAKVQQALTKNSSVMQSALGGDTAAIMSQLETDQGGLQSDLSTLESLQSSDASKLAAAQVGGTSSIQSSLSSSLSQVLDEVDSSAQSVASVVTGSTQQLSSALRATSSAAGHDLEENVRLEIEQGLASAHPELSLELPASAGGLLDARPVGVRSVVEGDLGQGHGVRSHVVSTAQQLAASGDVALAGHRYLAAFDDYRRAYLALAGG